MKRFNVVWGLLWGAPHRFMRRGEQRRHPLTASILIFAMVAQVGCASSGTDKRSASSLHFPVPRAAIQELGKVSVTSGRFAPTFAIVDVPSENTPQTSGCTPDKPEEFGCVLKGVLFAPLYVFLYFAVYAVLTPVVLIRETVKAIMPGSTVETTEPAVETTEPAVKVEERKVREATIREMVTSQRIQDDLRDRVVGIGASMTPHIFEGMTDRGPSTRGEQPDYLSLSQEGIQAVLEVVIERVTLDAIEEIPDPKFRLVMTVNTRLIRVVDNVEFYLYANKRTYYSKSLRTLAEWVSDPEGFRNELNQAYTDIAERIVKEVFLGTESN